MPTSVSVILKRAKALINLPDKLCRQSYAKDEGWKMVQLDSKKAIRFCMNGAIYRTCIGLDSKLEDQADQFLAQALGITVNDLTAFNDTHTHEEIMEAYDKAIVLALESQNGVETDEEAPVAVFCDADEPDVIPEPEAAVEPPKKVRKPRAKTTKPLKIEEPVIAVESIPVTEMKPGTINLFDI